jgi:hypothetical protein
MRILLLLGAAVVVVWLLTRQRPAKDGTPWRGAGDNAGWLVVYAKKIPGGLDGEVFRERWSLSTPGFGAQSLWLQQQYEQRGYLNVRVMYESDGLPAWARSI